MERIDKVISNQTGYSRKEVKELVRAKRVKVNDQLVLKSDEKVDLEKDHLFLDERELIIQKYVYLILNKPKGYVSATEDKNDLTVLELVPDEYRHRNLFPAGRLDKDTTGMMIITDDGEFAHEILAPKKHVTKTYLVTVDIPLTKEMQEGFLQGVELIDGVCKTSTLEILDEYHAKVILTEGRYHQIKRMFGVYKAKVLELKRVSMGNLFLPDDLEEGQCRELTEEELRRVYDRG